MLEWSSCSRLNRPDGIEVNTPPTDILCTIDVTFDAVSDHDDFLILRTPARSAAASKSSCMRFFDKRIIVNTPKNEVQLQF